MTSDPAPRESIPETAWNEARHLLRHCYLDDPTSHPDPLAVQMAGEMAGVWASESDNPADALARRLVVTLHDVARERLARALASGTRQVVILDGRLDISGLRHAEAHPDARFFAVQPPQTLSWRAECMARHRAATPRNLNAVSCDLRHDGLLPRLEAAGFNPMRPVFFQALGVLPTLHWEMRDALLRFISALPRGEVVFDYYTPLDLLDGGSAASAASIRAWIAELATGDASASTQREMEDLLELTNFRWFEDVPAVAASGAALPGARIVHARA